MYQSKGMLNFTNFDKTNYFSIEIISFYFQMFDHTKIIFFILNYIRPQIQTQINTQKQKINNQAQRKAIIYLKENNRKRKNKKKYQECFYFQKTSRSLFQKIKIMLKSEISIKNSIFKLIYNLSLYNNQLSFNMSLFYNFYPQIMHQYAYFDTNMLLNNVPFSIPVNIMFENYNRSVDYSNIQYESNAIKEKHQEMENCGKLEELEENFDPNKPKEHLLKQIPCRKTKSVQQQKCFNIQFLKKNTESNICNQILSFITLREKSQWYLSRILKNLGLDQLEISLAFYNHIQKVKGIKKKYVNRRKILELTTSNLPITSSSQFSITLFRKLVRILVRTYLEKCCRISILTSKKMSKDTCHPHLQRMRQIYKWLIISFKNNQSE